MLIGEVSRRSGVSSRMLRHYDSMGLVSPSDRTAAGYREYSADDLRRLLEVESLRSLGLSLREIHLALDDPGFTPSVLITDLIEQSRQRMARERELLARLHQIKAAEPADWDGVLHIVRLLRGLASEEATDRQEAVLSARGRLSPGALARAVLSEAEPNVAGTLRWALAEAGAQALPPLAAGLESPDPQRRLRAVLAIAEISDDDATTLLLPALDDQEAEVSRHAGLALGRRGRIEAVPALVGMVVEGVRDVEAAEVLGGLADRLRMDDRIVAMLTRGLDDAGTTVRLRIVQALAEIPGHAAERALTRLAGDPDRRVSLTAQSIQSARGKRLPPDG
ncbi:MerR family transcriptional regulator [Brooklawnia cerclae]|uniref:DNA-binding transcriptional MerR regulator n=1 Tax=Brooklawnia cerclae TaxID=349934 RepID=A0ABX0SHF9_9ACTN|nr:MerR family transcriptional regulator [Brooklawnia cerclae]NIH57844.1 DNA-binding transcriptional MerR regulator [Brooklawnia cerclae]